MESVWAVVSDPARALSYMSGVTRWEVVGDEPTGLGARYRMLMRVGSAEVGGLIEIVEWDEPRELAWNSITGVDQRGRWRLRPAPRRPYPGRDQARLRRGRLGNRRLARRADRRSPGREPPHVDRAPTVAAGRARAPAGSGPAAASGPGRLDALSVRRAGRALSVRRGRRARAPARPREHDPSSSRAQPAGADRCAPPR